MHDSGNGEGLTISTTVGHGTLMIEPIEALAVQWGIDRKIIGNSTAFAQARKTLEEVFELHQAVMHEDLLDIEDAIGDIWVTLVMVCQCHGMVLGPKLFLDTESDTLQNGRLRLVEMIVKEMPNLFMAAAHNWHETVHHICKDIELLLQAICWQCHLNYEEAKLAAYEQIKDRKGYLREDGIFVKE